LVFNLFDKKLQTIGFFFSIFSYKNKALYVLTLKDRNQTVLQRFKPNSGPIINQRTVEPLKAFSLFGNKQSTSR